LNALLYLGNSIFEKNQNFSFINNNLGKIYKKKNNKKMKNLINLKEKKYFSFFIFFY
jgi:hypothetical protein